MFDVKELENIRVDLGVAGKEVLNDSVGGGVLSECGGVDMDDSLRINSTIRKETGKRISRHAYISKARIDSAIVLMGDRRKTEMVFSLSVDPFVNKELAKFFKSCVLATVQCTKITNKKCGTIYQKSTFSRCSDD